MHICEMLVCFTALCNLELRWYFQALLNEIEMKNDGLANIEAALNSLKTRCGPNVVKAIAKQLTSLQNKQQACLERARKVK